MEKERCGNVLKPWMGALCRFSKEILKVSRHSGLYKAETTVEVYFVKPQNLEKKGSSVFSEEKQSTAVQ